MIIQEHKRDPDHGKKMDEQVLHGKEIAAQHKDDAPYEGSSITGLECFQEKIGKNPCQKKMQDNNEIKGIIKRKKKKKKVWRIEDAGLKGGKQGLPTGKKGVPQRDRTDLDHVRPQFPWGYEKDG